MGNPFSRLSLAMVSVIAAALIFGFLAGGVVIHRFETASQTSTTQHDGQAQQAGEKDSEQGDKNDTSDQPKKSNPQPPKSSKATGARTSEPNEND